MQQRSADQRRRTSARRQSGVPPHHLHPLKGDEDCVGSGDGDALCVRDPRRVGRRAGGQVSACERDAKFVGERLRCGDARFWRPVRQPHRPAAVAHGEQAVSSKVRQARKAAEEARVAREPCTADKADAAAEAAVALAQGYWRRAELEACGHVEQEAEACEPL